MRDRKGETVSMENEIERKTEHDSQILQISVMWFNTGEYIQNITRCYRISVTKKSFKCI